VRVRACAGAALLGCVLSLFGAGTAAASFGPIQLVSKSAAEQAAEALSPALSANGRYLAFRGAIGGLKGVFRKDLATGAVTPVAAGSASAADAPGVDASAPSISADGRYVSFDTKSPLDPADDKNEATDVYVADMSTSPPTYELASAADESPQGLTYESSGGSVASGRVALSADGREVVFVTTASSDLAGASTPAGQVVLRNLAKETTTLVSVERDSATGAMTDLPVPGGAVIERPLLSQLRGAALSADGTTVAWLGANLQSQVPLLAGEAAAISAQNNASPFPYDEPLWRRIADGPGAPTRRIVGGDPSPAFAGLTARNTEFNSAEGWLGVGGIDGVPQLSADGRTVALIGNPTNATNVFVVDMDDGLSRSQAVRQLTREVQIRPAEPERTINQEPFVSLNGYVYDLAISSDGKRIALTTARQQFPLAPPNLVGSPPSSLGLVELYLIDLEGETLQRVTHGTGGVGEASLSPVGSGQDGFGAASPSIDAAGGLVAFSSTASNLVAGDGNEAADAFVVEDTEAPSAPGSVAISSPPPPLARRPRWRLTLSAFSLPDGNVRLVASVPAAGALRAQAGAALGSAARRRLLVAARARARRDGPVALTLKLPRRYRRLAHSREGLYATARVAFRGSGGKRLRGRLEVRFHAHRRHRGGRR
jgi:Tol biopolymer transport system component